jgi:hypothetical protein
VVRCVWYIDAGSPLASCSVSVCTSFSCGNLHVMTSHRRHDVRPD